MLDKQFMKGNPVSWNQEVNAEDKEIQEELRSGAKLPGHVAVIMDGNGRWAVERGMSRINGHREGIESVRDIVKTASQIGIKYLTLYAFLLKTGKGQCPR
jgi:undecaprenyl diphosphate synthase